jgi:hypothetical protein
VAVLVGRARMDMAAGLPTQAQTVEPLQELVDSMSKREAENGAAMLEKDVAIAEKDAAIVEKDAARPWLRRMWLWLRRMRLWLSRAGGYELEARLAEGLEEEEALGAEEEEGTPPP